MTDSILLFEKNRIFKSDAQFFKWYNSLMVNNSNYDYMNPSNPDSNLIQAVYELNELFPDENGPFAPYSHEMLETLGMQNKLAHYYVGKDFVFVRLPHLLSEDDMEKVRMLALKYNLGYSDMNQIYLWKPKYCWVNAVNEANRIDIVYLNKWLFVAKFAGILLAIIFLVVSVCMIINGFEPVAVAFISIGPMLVPAIIVLEVLALTKYSNARRYLKNTGQLR